MTLGQRICELRKQHNLSQEALGDQLGVSRQAISRWEMDGAVPEIDKLIAMSKLFAVSLNKLLGVEEPVKPRPEPAQSRRKRPRTSTLLLAAALLVSLLFNLSYRHRLQTALDSLYQLSDLEETFVDSVDLFRTLEYSLSPIDLGFPQARGTQNLTIDLSLKLAKPLKGWEIASLRAEVSGHDPWGEYPDGTKVPEHRRNWDDARVLEITKPWFGPSKASLTLENYGGETVRLSAVLRETSTGRTIETGHLFCLTTDAERGNNFTVEELIPVLAHTPAFVPRSIASRLPLPPDEWTL